VLRPARFSDHLDGHLHPDSTEGDTFFLSSDGVSYCLPSLFLRRRTAYFRGILPAPNSRSASGSHTWKTDGPRRAMAVNVSAEVLTLVLFASDEKKPSPPTSPNIISPGNPTSAVMTSSGASATVTDSSSPPPPPLPRPAALLRLFALSHPLTLNVPTDPHGSANPLSSFPRRWSTISGNVLEL
jgi:hypothetical protein